MAGRTYSKKDQQMCRNNDENGQKDEGCDKKWDIVSSKAENVNRNNTDLHKTTCFTKDACPEISFFSLELYHRLGFNLLHKWSTFWIVIQK